MATNYNLAAGDPTSAYTTAPMPAGNGLVKLVCNTVNLKGTTALDTFTLAKLPAGASLVAVSMKSIEDPDETCTIDLGYQTGATTVGQEFVAGWDLNAATVGTPVLSATAIFIASGEATAVAKFAVLAADAYVGAKVATGTTLAKGKFQVTITYFMA